jgi:hypothetical protein
MCGLTVEVDGRKRRESWGGGGVAQAIVFVVYKGKNRAAVIGRRVVGVHVEGNSAGGNNVALKIVREDK